MMRRLLLVISIVTSFSSTARADRADDELWQQMQQLQQGGNHTVTTDEIKAEPANQQLARKMTDFEIYFGRATSELEAAKQLPVPLAQYLAADDVAFPMEFAAARSADVAATVCIQWLAIIYRQMESDIVHGMFDSPQRRALLEYIARTESKRTARMVRRIYKHYGQPVPPIYAKPAQGMGSTNSKRGPNPSSTLQGLQQHPNFPH